MLLHHLTTSTMLLNYLSSRTVEGKTTDYYIVVTFNKYIETPQSNINS